LREQLAALDEPLLDI